MIVKCEQCQTRFKIPDDKVTDRGVKVRCTKCGTTFRVAKDGTPMPSVAGAAPPTGRPPTHSFPEVQARPPPARPPVALGGEGDDPFSSFGSASPVPVEERTRPGVFPLGLEASKVPDMRAAPLPPRAPVMTPTAGSAFDFGSLAPPVSAPVPAMAPAPSRPAPRTTAPMVPAPPVTAPVPAPAPFDFSVLMSTSLPAAPVPPAPFDLSASSGPLAGPEPSPPGPSAAPAAGSTPAFEFSEPGPGTPAGTESGEPAFDFSGLGTGPPQASAPGSPAFELSPPGSPAFELSPPGSPAFELSPPGSPAFELSPPGSQAYDFSPPPVTSPPASAVTAPATPAFQLAALEPLPGPGPERSAPQPLTTRVAIPLETQPSRPPLEVAATTDPAATQPARPALPPVRPQSSAPLSMDGDELGRGPASGAPRSDQMPSLFGGASPGADDFFGGAPPEAPRPSPGPDITSGTGKGALFDLAAALPSLPEEEPPTVIEAPLEAPVAKPADPKPPVAAPEPPRRHHTALGVVVNLVIGGALVLALVVVGSALLNGGQVSADTLTWAHLKTTFAPSSDYVAGDISSGLYDTKAGKPVFFVRGEVTNRGTKAAKLQVRAELLEGDALVRAAESPAGAPASPEEVFLLTSPEALDALTAQLDARAPVVAPGESATFVVVFFEYPPDLKGFRVRVSTRATGAPTAARGP